MRGDRADLLVTFLSPHHTESAPRLPGLLARHFPGAMLVGCSGGGVIGAGHEVEDAPAFSLTADS